MSLSLTPRNKDGTTTGLPAPFRLDRGEAVVGRGAEAQVVLSNPAVSRRHCVIGGEGAAWQVTDTSTGGTLLNGQRLTGAQALHDGDVLTVAEFELAVAIGKERAQSAAAARMNLDSWQRDKPAARAPVPPSPAAVSVPGSWEQTQPPASGAAAPTGWDRTQAPAAGPAAAPAPALPTGDQAQRPAARHGSPTGPGAQLLQAAGLARSQVAASDEQVMAVAGALLRTGIEGLGAMLRARRKARAEMGVADGGPPPGPIEAGASPQEVLAGLLAQSPSVAGEAVAAACRELEAHERETLAAMQSAFAAALDQFAPEAIRLRASSDAAAWKAYEQAFAATDGFVEAFARELARDLSGRS